MFFLLGGNEKKTVRADARQSEPQVRIKELLLNGKFPVVTTDKVEELKISTVLGLVCCRGYDSEEACFGMPTRAVSKGTHTIVGYSENVAFHPDGSKFFSCFGTAAQLNRDTDRNAPLAVVTFCAQRAQSRPHAL